MKTVHLHIGSQKTGTTSVQGTFYENDEKLKEQDFLYPGGRRPGHLFYLATKAEKEDWPRQFKSMRQNSLQKLQKSYFSSLEQGFRSDVSHQIISTEYLFINNEVYIKNIIDLLDEFFDEIKVYLFVRSPITYYRSLQQQKIKARSYIKSPDYFKYQFRGVVEAWDKMTDLTVIPYSSGVDSCRVLCNKMGIDYSKLTIIERNSNSSLSLEQMNLLEKIQSHFYQDHDDIFKNHLSVLHQVSASFLHKPQLQEWVKPIIYQNHQEDLKWLDKKYSIDFLEGYPEIDARSDYPVFENGKASVRDVYKIPSTESLEKYEALVIDALLKKLIQNN